MRDMPTYCRDIQTWFEILGKGIGNPCLSRQVFRSDQDPNGMVFIRWYDDLEKNILTVVISDAKDAPG